MMEPEATRDEILDLLSRGKVTATEAAEMLSALAGNQPGEKGASKAAPAGEKVKPAESNSPPSDQVPAWFRIRVSDLDGRQNRVSVNIPLRLLDTGLWLARRFTAELDHIDPAEVHGLIRQAGTLVEVEDEASNERVHIYVD